MSGQRRVPVLAKKDITSATGDNSYLAMFVDDYMFASLQVIASSLVGHVGQFEVSNDAVGDAYTGAWDGTSGTWYSILANRTNGVTPESNTVTLSSTPAYGWSIPLNGWRWFRVRASAHTSGTATYYLKPQYRAGFLPAPTNLSSSISGGQAAHDAAVSGSPVRVAGRGKTTNYTAVADNDTADLITTVVGALIQKSYSIPELDWSYVAASGGISNTTTAVTIKAAAGAGIRNYITALQITSDALTAATEIAIRDGAGGTVLWREKIGTAGLIGGLGIVFPSPLKSTANTLLEVVTLTASIAGAVYFNAQGYAAP